MAYLQYKSKRCALFLAVRWCVGSRCHHVLGVRRAPRADVDYRDLLCPSMESGLDFSRTTTLQFSTQTTLDPSFGPLFSRFLSLDAIIIDSTSLGHLMDLQDDMNTTDSPCKLFPVLNVLNLDCSHFFNAGSKTDESVKVAVKFILARIQDGHSIAVLNMAWMPPFDAPPDLEALEEVNGLEVRYRCLLGTGKSEHVYMRQQLPGKVIGMI